MKKYCFLLVLVLCVKSYSQTKTPSIGSYIEVTGSAEIAVKPDVYVINLRINDKLFTSFSSQEKKLGTELSKAGIQSSDFLLTTVSSDWQKQNLPTNDRTQYRDYLLRIQTEKQLPGIFDALYKAGVEQSYVAGVDYTKKAAIISKLGIEALNNAKEKASTSLSALNVAPRNPLAIVEEYAGPELFNDGLLVPPGSTSQRQMENSAFERPSFNRNYESIQFKVSYRVTYNFY